MARKPLAAIVALAFALQASAPVALAQPPESLDDARRKAAAAFASKTPLKAEELEPLKARAHALGQREFDAFAKLHAEARYVQKGREPGDDAETYALMVRSVARRLGLPRSRYDELVQLYAGVEIARGQGTAYTASHSPPTEDELEARKGIQDDIRRNRGISEARRNRVQADMRSTSRRLSELIQDADEDAPAPGAARGPASVETAVVVAERRDLPEELKPLAERNYSRVPPQVERPAFVTSETPPPGGEPPVTASPLSWASLTGWLDLSKGYEVAKEAFTGTLNWTRSMGSMCYRFVKKALIDAGVIDAPDPSSTAVFGLRPASARMLNEDIRKNPQLLAKMGYRRVDLATIGNDASAIPDGSLLGYDAGCSFADPAHGHAEIVVGADTYEAMRLENKKLVRINAAPNEARVCHFACTTRTTQFLRTYGTDRKNRAGKTISACLKMYVPVKAAAP